MTMTHKPCAEPGCLDQTHRTFSRYCGKHMLCGLRYGSVRGRPLKKAELQKYRKPIAQVIHFRRKSPAVQAALKDAEELLNFTPVYGWNVEHNIAAQMQRLKSNGITPRMLLRRACEVFFVELLDEERFGHPKEARYAVAREVLKLANMNSWRPNATLLNHFGEELRERFALFAARLVEQVELYHNERARRLKDKAEGWETVKEAKARRRNAE